jgi:hypothetical protein
MSKRGTDLAHCLESIGSVRHMQAWLLLIGSLAVHVIDEAMTGFLDFYNPLELGIRSQIPWFPMPTFAFGIWFAALAVLVLVPAGLAPVVRRCGTAIWLASWVLGTVMVMNGVGHLAGSVYFQRWLPGATSAPLPWRPASRLKRASASWSWKR